MSAVTVQAKRPRYRQVAEKLKSAIEAGEYPVGSLLPTESELCASFNISRYTAREALRRLAEMGLVSRRQGAGTYVEAQVETRRYTQTLTSMTDLLQYAHDTEFRTNAVGTRKLGREEAEALELPQGEAWVTVAGQRFRPGATRPFCVTDVFIPRRFAAIQPRIPDHDVPIYQLLESRFGITIVRITQDLQATTLDARQADRLGVAPGDAALRIVRRYYDDSGEVVEVAVSLHPGDLFTYSMELQSDAT